VVASNWQRSLSYAPAKNIKLFCEFPFAPNPTLVPRASEHDVGGDSDPKGEIADDWEMSIKTPRIARITSARDDKSKVHLHTRSW